MKNTSFIWVTFQREGIHYYAQAKDDPQLATGGWDDVSFLGYPHRHMFHFKIEAEVFHDDRDIEFIQFKRFCNNLYDASTLQLNGKSCEMIADDLYAVLSTKYGTHRAYTITVSEDGENGATINYVGKHDAV